MSVTARLCNGSMHVLGKDDTVAGYVPHTCKSYGITSQCVVARSKNGVRIRLYEITVASPEKRYTQCSFFDSWGSSIPDLPVQTQSMQIRAELKVKVCTDMYVCVYIYKSFYKRCRSPSRQFSNFFFTVCFFHARLAAWKRRLDAIDIVCSLLVPSRERDARSRGNHN